MRCVGVFWGDFVVLCMAGMAKREVELLYEGGRGGGGGGGWRGRVCGMGARALAWGDC